MIKITVEEKDLQDAFELMEILRKAGFVMEEPNENTNV